MFEIIIGSLAYSIAYLIGYVAAYLIGVYDLKKISPLTTIDKLFLGVFSFGSWASFGVVLIITLFSKRRG